MTKLYYCVAKYPRSVYQQPPEKKGCSALSKEKEIFNCMRPGHIFDKKYRKRSPCRAPFLQHQEGVAIFINNNFEQKVHKETKDRCGKLLMLDITIEGEKTEPGEYLPPQQR